MKQVSGKKLCQRVEQQGWRLLRIHGSHHIYGKPGVNIRLSIPVHANRPLKLGLLQHLLKQSGLTENDL
jgi:predicted RNA binding protein YcfA (HicA-like mRNA interferase family)